METTDWTAVSAGGIWSLIFWNIKGIAAGVEILVMHHSKQSGNCNEESKHGVRYCVIALVE